MTKTQTISMTAAGPEAAAGTAQFLTPVVLGLQSLAVNGKQAHWNVRGTNFIAIHELLDTVVANAQGFADLAAERIVALGLPVDARLSTIADKTTATNVPAGFAQWQDVIAAVVTDMDVVIADVHGTVRYRWAGRVPTRDADRRWTGWRTDRHRVDLDLVILDQEGQLLYEVIAEQIGLGHADPVLAWCDEAAERARRRGARRRAREADTDFGISERAVLAPRRVGLGAIGDIGSNGGFQPFDRGGVEAVQFADDVGSSHHQRLCPVCCAFKSASRTKRAAR